MTPAPFDLPLPIHPALPSTADTSAEVGQSHSTEHPSITVYLPETNPTQTALVIVPGGGYGGRAVDHEGHEVARWLQSGGLAGVVLHYRLPQRDALPVPLPLRDAHAALHLIRTHASVWNIDAHRVGIMGFSAGGHLVSMTGTLLEPAERPDFMVLVYPVISMRDGITHEGTRTNLLGDNRSPELLARFSTDENVTATTPPTLLIHARDDAGVPLENTLRFAHALQQAGVSRETIVYERGGHGFGYSRATGETAEWPRRVEEWLRGRNLMAPQTTENL